MSKRPSRDRGMTLPEVLISVTLTGLLVTALAMSITVVLKQSDNSTGRVNNARSEQNVSMWMPSDLASADTVDTNPASMPCDLPCPAGAELGGSNALMLTWTIQTFDPATGTAVNSVTKVSYRYLQQGTEWVMVRVECNTVGSSPTTCQSNIVLHNLDGPPAGQTFVAGVSTPTWIIQVSQALDPAATGAPGETVPVDPTLQNKNGQRVVVTINGGGDYAGAGGGTNQISLSAGGTERKQNLATSDPSGVPPFIAARSRCGGNFAMVVDLSGSIGATNMGATISATPNWATLRGSIYKFIEAFEGTPVKLELVTFSTSALTVGAAGDAQMYYDMLDPTQVATLKSIVGYPNTAGGFQSNGSTNWEDAFYQLFRKSDGTVEPILPKTVIFFTDGVPTNSRIQSDPPQTMDPSDAPLPGPSGGTFYQVGWNRANRVMRVFDADVEKLIGMYVGSASATSTWKTTQGYHEVNWQRGYHLTPERGNNMVYERGYHDDYQRNANVVWERGYHDDYQRGNNVVWERGYHDDYQRGNNVTFQYATTGIDFQQYKNGVWSSESASNYLSKNTTNDSTDGHRVVITGALGGWTSMTATQYNASNTAVGSADGFQTVVTGSATAWTSVTATEYNLSNSTADASDGYQIAKAYSSPYSSWESTTSTIYGSNNTTADATDGWRTRQTSPSTSWTSVTAAEYNASNTTADATDGWQDVHLYSSPFSAWESTTSASYAAANTTTDATDGWRTRVNGSLSATWTSVTAAEYNASNTTADNTDGWQTARSYTSPYTSWESTTSTTYNSSNTVAGETDGWRTRLTAPSTTWTAVSQTTYNLSNTTADETDGWRISKYYSSPYSSWEPIDQATYDANNTTSDNTDGWYADHVYSEPFTKYEVVSSATMYDKDILGRFIQPVGNTVGPILDAGGNVTNAETANLYSLADYSTLPAAMQAIALSECGGTLTIQTRIASTGQSAVDPFTYQNSIDQKVVTTTSQFRGGTFDFQTTSSVNPTITLQNLSDLSHYSPVSWSCTAKGQPRAFTTAPIPGGPWSSITVSVAANEAVSCTQLVQWTP